MYTNFEYMNLKEGNVAFILEYEFIEENMPELEELGGIFQEKSRNELGCLYYQVHYIEGYKNRILIYQAFLNEEALDKHLESEHFMEIGVRKITPKIVLRKITRLQPLIR